MAVMLARVNGIEQLCPNCGLCCDSTLFADVELRAGDNATQLKKLGLSVQKKGQGKLAFAQPCACFDGKLCRIYEGRPRRCRTFACGLLKRVETGEMTVPAALKKISGARKEAEKVRELLQRAGHNDEAAALTHRYTQAMSAPLEVSDEHASECRGELMLAVNALMQLVQRDFLR
jgi:Fe-S-cluster containining protein